MNKSMIKILMLGLASSIAFPLLASEELHAEDAHIRAMPPGQEVTAAFFKLVNHSDQTCVITGGSSPLAAAVEIHEHLHSDGMMKMRPVKSVTVDGGETLVFKPGGLHLMLFGVKQTLVPEAQQEITLATENCGSLVVTAEVRSLLKGKASHPKKDKGDKHHHHHMHHSQSSGSGDN